MPTQLQIPIVKVDMVPRETADGHTSSFLLIDTDERTVSVVQQVFDQSAMDVDIEHRWVRMSVPRLDHEMMTLLLQHQAQDLLARICDGCTVDVDDGQVVYELNDDAGEACMELEEMVNTLTY